MPKKKFIDKKHAVTFHLVHRSQKDPLQADEDASQRVLLPFNADQNRKIGEEERKEQERKFGVHFDDEYDYLQHLKETNEINYVGLSEEPVEHFVVKAKNKHEKPKIKLSSTLFGSEMETEVGLLNKAAPRSGPRLDWDPEIVAGLDEDFDYEDPSNVLDDDFIMSANAEERVEESGDTRSSGFGFGTKKIDRDENDKDSEDSEEDDAEGKNDDHRTGHPSTKADDTGYPSDEADDVGSDSFPDDDGFSFTDEETKSRFTEYSVTSSVIRRNKGLTLLDDRFEKFFEQYDDEELGALEHEEIDGRMDPNSKILTSMMEDFQKQQLRHKLKLKAVIEKVEGLAMESGSDGEANMDITEYDMKELPDEKWDCASILTTYSNLENRPKLIREPRKVRLIKVDERSGLPMAPPPETRGLSLKEIEKEMNARNVGDRACTYRPGDESTEERKYRKAAIREERKLRREEKKATKLAFRKEGILHNKERINAARTEGVKLS